MAAVNMQTKSQRSAFVSDDGSSREENVCKWSKLKRKEWHELKSLMAEKVKKKK